MRLPQLTGHARVVHNIVSFINFGKHYGDEMKILSSIRNRWLYSSLCLLCCSFVPGVKAESAATSARKVVEHLYQDYAWVILLDNSDLVGLVNQPEQELSKYFTASLAGLIRKDHKCAEETKDVCNLDFDPIYDSQDPDGAHQLRIEPMDSNSVVKVAFLRRWSSPDTAELKFKMIYTSSGWRIDNIYYQGHKSIREILQQKSIEKNAK